MTRPSVGRSPVLLPGACSGLGIADARATRLGVEPDGSVALRREGRTTTLAAPHDVARVVAVLAEDVPRRWRVGRSHGLIALLSDTAPIAVVDPADWSPNAIGLMPVDLRVASGAEAVAQALGVTVEGATPDETARVLQRGAGHVIRPLESRHGRVEDLALVAALVLGFFAAVAGHTWLGVVLASLTAVPTVVVAARLHRRRRRFRQLVDAPPPAGDRREVTSRLAPAWRGLAQSVLQLGRDDVVHHASGRETWLLGPARGGVRRCVIAGDDFVLLDGRGRTLMRVDARAFDAVAVADAARVAGIDFESTPLPTAPGSLRHGDLDHAWHPAISGMTEAELGSTTAATPALALCAALMLLAASLSALRTTVAALLITVAALVSLALVIHAWLLLGRWWRRSRATRDALDPQEEP